MGPQARNSSKVCGSVFSTLLYASKRSNRKRVESIIGRLEDVLINSFMVIILGANIGFLYARDNSAIRNFEARSEGKTITK